MANIQKQFDEFHSDIKLSDENSVLIEKRDKLKTDLENGLKGSNLSVVEYVLQGSYAIYTGIKPKDGDFDIDVGVVMGCTRSDYAPVKLKEKVKEAIENNFRKPEIKRPCVTVQYKKDGENHYHVDMPVYVKEGENYFLAVGKVNSSDENKYWESADPKYLVNWINDVSTQSRERDQFRRLVKYIKHWKNNKLNDGNCPPSIGFTILARSLYIPVFGQYDDKPNDLSALRKLINNLISRFSLSKYDENGQPVYRLKAELPCTPWKDTFEKVTDNKMARIKENLKTFLSDLDEAIDEERLEEACKIIRRHLKDFPQPPKEATAKVAVASITNTGSSS
jgi:Second Messenger Oligonucleotide or Dinucleotide Synthetase domain